MKKYFKYIPLLCVPLLVAGCTLKKSEQSNKEVKPVISEIKKQEKHVDPQDVVTDEPITEAVKDEPIPIDYVNVGMRPDDQMLKNVANFVAKHQLKEIHPGIYQTSSGIELLFNTIVIEPEQYESFKTNFFYDEDDTVFENLNSINGPLGDNVKNWLFPNEKLSYIGSPIDDEEYNNPVVQEAHSARYIGESRFYDVTSFTIDENSLTTQIILSNNGSDTDAHSEEALSLILDFLHNYQPWAIF